jgi:uncharacterized membrane protein YecN with MAPEG domain
MIGFHPHVHPGTTMLTAAVLGLIYFALSVWVVRQRWVANLSLGLPADPKSPLFRIGRAHSNFAEYVPFLLLMMFFLESTGAAAGGLRAVGIVLVIGRIAHTLGILEHRAPNPARIVGVLLNFGLLLVLPVWIFLREL